MGDGVTSRRRRFGDRYDGRLLRSLSPIYQMIPYVMRTRVDAQDYFEDRIDIGPAEAWLRRQRAAGRANLGYLALFMAALVRIIHHLYEFGTVSIFLAFGAKEREHALAADGRVEVRKSISIKVVNDERICDGHYYASAFKLLRGLLRQPELLEAPPDRVEEDQD